MDTFKLLARSTNLNSSTSSSRRRSAHVPSAGETSDPQLFRDTVQEHSQVPHESQSGGRKRKRDRSILTKSSARDLDVFSTPLSSSRDRLAGKEPKSDTKSAVKSGTDKPGSEGLEQGLGRSLHADQRIRILQGHKIKITDLSEQQLTDSTQKENGANGLGEKKRRKKAKAVYNPHNRKKLKELRRLYPDPLVTFEQLRTQYGISRRLYQNIQDQRFTVPTEVQL